MSKMGAVGPTAAPPARAVDRDWVTVAACTVGLILCNGTLTVYTIGVFVRPLGHEFHWTRTQLFGALAVFEYALAFASPAWGWITDRLGPRRAMLISAIMASSLIGSLMWLTPHLWHLYAVFALIPVVAGALSPLGFSSVIVRRFDRRLGLALGLAPVVGVGVGATVMPPVIQALVARFGWREAFLAEGVLAAVVTLPSIWVATRGDAGTPTADRRTVSLGDVVGMVSSRAFVFMAVAFFLLGVVTVGTISNFVPMMVDRGFSPGKAAALAGLSGLAAIFARGGFGWVLDRLHAPYVLAGVALLAGFASLLLAAVAAPAAGYVAAVILGTTVGAEIDFISFLVRRYFPQAAFSRLYGLTFGAYILGSGVGPLILAASFDRMGGYGPGLLLLAVLCGVVALLSFWMPRYVRPSGVPSVEVGRDEAAAAAAGV